MPEPQTQDPGGRIPEAVQESWEQNDLDDLAEWLLGLPEGVPMRGRAAEMARDAAEALVTIDPAVALRLLDRLLQDEGESLHLLELSVDAASRAGDAAKAKARAEAARVAARRLEGPERAAVLNNLGVFLKEGRQYEDAESVLEEAIGAAGDDLAHLVAALVNLSTLHMDRAQYRGEGSESGPRAALDALERAERVAEVAGDDARLGTIWFNRGHLHATSGASAEAAGAYARAEHFFVAAGSDPYDLAFLHRARAADAGRNGRLPDAIDGYMKSRDLFAEAGRLDESATAAVGLIMALQLSGQTPTPEQQDDLLSALRRSRPDRVPELLINLGNIAVEQDLDAAERYFLDAEAAFREQGREVDEQRARHAQAVIWRRRGDPGRAMAMLEAVRARYREWGLDVKVAEATFNIGLVRRDQKDPAALEDALEAFEFLDRHRHGLGTASDRAGLLRVTYPHLHNLVIDAALLSGEADVIAALSERARTQTNLGQGRIAGADQLAPPVPVRARPGSRIVGGNGGTRTLSTLAHALGGADAAWLGWVRHRDSLVRVVVAGDDVDISTVPYPHDLLAELADATLLERAGAPSLESTRAALYRIATGPILADAALAARIKGTLLHGEATPWKGRAATTEALLGELADALLPERAWEAESVVLAPPSWLGSIPWAALQRGGRAWIEHARLALAPPVGTIRAASQDLKGTGRVWLADPRGDLRYCRRTLPGWDVLSGASRTADREHVVGALVRGGRVVVRGHVRPGTADRPRAAALVLSDVALTADDLRAAIGTVPAEWVILGCDAAGAGVGDEWAGLPVALGSAGAERLIVTLWPIVDAPEQEELDLDLVARVERLGVAEGLYEWQAAQAAHWRESADPAVSPHRWAGHVLVLTAEGRRSPSASP